MTSGAGLDPAPISGNRADFFAKRLSVNHDRRGKVRDQRSDLMTFGSRLSVITAYLAMAFVGAIVFGIV